MGRGGRKTMLSGFDWGRLRTLWEPLDRPWAGCAPFGSPWAGCVAAQPTVFQVATCPKMRRPPLRSADPAEEESAPPPSSPSHRLHACMARHRPADEAVAPVPRRGAHGRCAAGGPQSHYGAVRDAEGQGGAAAAAHLGVQRQGHLAALHEDDAEPAGGCAEGGAVRRVTLSEETGAQAVGMEVAGK